MSNNSETAVDEPTGAYKALIEVSDRSLVNIKQIRDGAILSDFNYTHDQFVQSLLASVEKVTISTPLLPRGTFKYCKSKEGEKDFCFVEIPPQIKNILYHTAVFEDIPFPRLLFGFVLTEYNEGFAVPHVYVAAIKDSPVLQDDTPVYYYPFTNVYSHFKVCWGSNSLPVLESLPEARVIIEMFFNSPNNDDLYGHANISNLSFRELLQEIQQKEVFPEEYLKSTGKTIANWIQDCME